MTNALIRRARICMTIRIHNYQHIHTQPNKDKLRNKVEITIVDLIDQFKISRRFSREFVLEKSFELDILQILTWKSLFSVIQWLICSTN